LARADAVEMMRGADEDLPIVAADEKVYRLSAT